MENSTSSSKIAIRIPWKEYFRKQSIKLLGFIIIACLIIGVMFVSQQMGELQDISRQDPNYLFAVFLSSICFILVLIGFSKIVLFDMGKEFGLRDEKTDKTRFDLRFFLFSTLALSFCSAMYLLLDVFLGNAYLELLPVLLMEWIIISFDIQITGLTDKLGDRREFYQTARNLYFNFFFLIIVGFSVLIFLSILTSFGRKRLIKRYRKDETVPVSESEENRRLYKLLLWLSIPFITIFELGILPSTTGLINSLITLLLVIGLLWWIFQILKTIFIIIWRGFKFSAFITSVNLLLIIPLILILYVLPVLAWTFWDIFSGFQGGTIQINLTEIINNFISFLQFRAQDILSIVELDFIFVTIIATAIVGFAEGFVIVAIFSAIYRGVEVARTGQIVSRSPPKIAVLSKYLILLGIWISLIWDSFLEIWEMLLVEFNFSLPEINVPTFFYVIYYSLIIPFSQWFEDLIPILKIIPFLLLPIYFVFSGAYKFLSVTLVTPRVKERLSLFFLLISTSFVLIITNILGDIYDLAIPDAPLKSVLFLERALTHAVGIFEYIEALTFYLGFFYGLAYVINKFLKSRKKKPMITEYIPENDHSKLIEKIDDENTELPDSNLVDFQKSVNDVQKETINEP
ncbi:hypothetical protein [Candidatus Hodarchaeum mangrovi]